VLKSDSCVTNLSLCFVLQLPKLSIDVPRAGVSPASVLTSEDTEANRLDLFLVEHSSDSSEVNRLGVSSDHELCVEDKVQDLANLWHAESSSDSLGEEVRSGVSPDSVLTSELFACSRGIFAGGDIIGLLLCVLGTGSSIARLFLDSDLAVSSDKAV